MNYFFTQAYGITKHFTPLTYKCISEINKDNSEINKDNFLSCPRRKKGVMDRLRGEAKQVQHEWSCHPVQKQSMHLGRYIKWIQEAYIVFMSSDYLANI